MSDKSTHEIRRNRMRREDNFMFFYLIIAGLGVIFGGSVLSANGYWYVALPLVALFFVSTLWLDRHLSRQR